MDKKLYEDIETIKDAAPHAIILSDFGVYNTVKKELPNIDIHISTQTNTLNSEAVKFWRDLGAKRVILARELSLKQIEEKNYAAALEAEGMPAAQIRKYGFAFEGKKVWIG